MIQSNMKSYPLYDSSRTKDSYKQYKYEYTYVKHIDAFITLYTQTQKANPLYMDATYIGLTKYTEVNRHDRVGNYEVLYTLPSGRYVQLFMKEVIENGD